MNKIQMESVRIVFKKPENKDYSTASEVSHHKQCDILQDATVYIACQIQIDPSEAHRWSK